MISHVDNILQMCKATNLHDQVMKIFNLGSCLLRCLEKLVVKELLRQVELTLSKLKFRTNPENIWKEDHSHIALLLFAITILDISSNKTKWAQDTFLMKFRQRLNSRL